MENNRLIVLAPFQEKLSSEVLTPQLFDVRVYKTAEEAWTIFEQNKVSLFISNQAFIQSAPGGFLNAHCGLNRLLKSCFKLRFIGDENGSRIIHHSLNIFNNEVRILVKVNQIQLGCINGL